MHPVDSLRVLTHGLEIDVQRGERGVIHLTVRADQKHQGAWRRLRQYLAHAFFRAGDLCHPSQDQRAIRVVACVMRSATSEHSCADLGQPHVRELGPIQGADGNSHYQADIAYEGVQCHEDGQPPIDKIVGLRGEKGADDSHHKLVRLDPAILRALGNRCIVIWPDPREGGK